MIVDRNITLADVVTETVTLPLLHERKTLLAQRTMFRHNPFGIVDPKAKLKEKGPVDELTTLVSFDNIEKLCELASELV